MFDNAKDIKIFGGQFKNVSGDLYEYNDNRYTSGSYNSAFNYTQGSHNNGFAGPSHPRVDFEAIRRDAHARAAAMRKKASAWEKHAEQTEREQGQQAMGNQPGGRRPAPAPRMGTEPMWKRRSPAPMNEEFDSEGEDDFQSSASSNHEPFPWARAGTDQPQPQRAQRPAHFAQPTRTSSNGFDIPHSRTAPPYLDPMESRTRSPGYSPASPEPEQNWGRQDMRGGGQLPNWGNPFLFPGMPGARQPSTFYRPGGGAAIDSFNRNETVIENSYNNNATYIQDDEDEADAQRWRTPRR